MKQDNQKKYLGIDWGEKRIGLALGDSETRLSLPFRTAASLNEVLNFLEEEKIDAIVIGAPQKMSGAAANNPHWQRFLVGLQKSKKEIILLDERLSSAAADALFGTKKEKAGRDEIAAALILQQYLDGIES